MDLRHLMIIAGYLFFISGYAQQNQFDSLYKANITYNKQDEKKLSLLNNLSYVYQWRQLDSGIAFADKAIALAQKLNNKKGLAVAFNNRAINCIQKGDFSKAGELLQRALSINTIIRNNIGIADNYFNGAVICYLHGDQDSANMKFGQAYKLYQQTGDRNGMGNVNYWMGYILTSDSTCLAHYYQAIRLFEQAGNKAGISLTYNGLGCYFLAVSDYTKALEWFDKAIKLNTQNNLFYNLALDYLNSSGIYYNMANYPKQLEYLLNSLRITEQTGAHMIETYCLGGISELYMELKQYPMALKYILRCNELSEQMENISYLSYQYSQIGTLHSKMNNPDKAFEYFDKSLQLAIKVKNEYDQAFCYHESGRAYHKFKQFDKAIETLRKAMVLDARLLGKVSVMHDMYDLGKCITDAPEAMLIKAGINPPDRTRIAIAYFQQVIVYADRNVKRDAFLELSRIYEQKGDTGNSFNYYKQYIILKDSIMNAENSKSLMSIQIQYDTEKKEKEIKYLNQNKQIQLQEINKQKLLRNGFIGGFFVMLLFAGVFFLQRKKIKIGNAALQVAKERAEQSERYKQQFLANMSHEIRTPMNAVMGMTRLALDTPLQEKQKFYLEGIKRSGETLLHIINDILDLSKIEAGKMELEEIDFSLSDTLKQVRQTLNHRAEEKGLELLVSIDPKLPDVVIGDPVRLNQVLINLAGNAIKFTERGSVSIAVTKVDAGSAVQFSIIDTGIGIPQEKLQTVFEKFSQANASDNRKYGGTGLGLSISRQLVELMGGKISIASVEGSGTTFSFSVNFEKGSTEGLDQRRSSEEQVDGSILDGLSILVVDDNEYNRIVAKDTLESKSKAVVVAVGSAQEAIDLLKARSFDVVLMDVQMPGMNGFEATLQIRNPKSEIRNHNIPIIALTASVLRTDLDKCTAAGMDGCIVKPFKSSQLIVGIAQVLNIALRVGKKIEINNVQPASHAGRVTDLDYLTRFCEGDSARMKKYIDMFMASAPILIAKVKVAVDTNDQLEIVGQMHGYKTKFLMMGMKEAQDLATEIEINCLHGNNTESVNAKLLLLVREVETAEAELKMA